MLAYFGDMNLAVEKKYKILIQNTIFDLLSTHALVIS